MSSRTPQGMWVSQKVKAKPCPQCGQHFSKQRFSLHIKERHPKKRQK